jgi:hypothetical protein
VSPHRSQLWSFYSNHALASAPHSSSNSLQGRMHLESDCMTHVSAAPSNVCGFGAGSEGGAAWLCTLLVQFEKGVQQSTAWQHRLQSASRSRTMCQTVSCASCPSLPLGAIS